MTSAARADEREFYDGVYGAQRTSRVRQSIDSVTPKWHLPDAPENKIVLELVGDVADKNVLLLGNGESVKELAFLKMNPRHLAYSDLSTRALANISDRFDLDQYRERLTFAALDAHSIPFAEGAFDLIYGFAMVHHLSDLDLFFASAMKSLKSGGKTVFMDDGFVPFWHHSKQTWLKPLMRFSHGKSGISPEDYRFSMSGGFKELELEDKIRRVGGEPYFVRASLLVYLFYRSSVKLLPRRLDQMLRRPRVSAVVASIDRFLCSLPLFKNNQIRLIWGFTKP